MRPLIWLTLFLAALYSGYWVVGSRSALAGVEAALAGMKAAGRADHAGVEIHGFPSRFDLTIIAPALASAGGEVRWQAEFLQLLALSYRPNRLIAVWPPAQRLSVGPATIAIASEDLRASVTLTPNSELPLDHAELAGRGVELATSPGWSLAADRLMLASRRSGGPQSHEIALVLTALRPGPQVKALLDPEGRLPAALPELRLGAIADLDRPLDRRALTAQPRLRALRAIDGSAAWGEIRLDARGGLTVGADGYATGRIELTARNWRGLLALATATGALTPEASQSLANGFAALAKAGGDENLLTLPLVFKDGMASLGPLALGPAPRF